MSGEGYFRGKHLFLGLTRLLCVLMRGFFPNLRLLKLKEEFPNERPPLVDWGLSELEL